MTTHAQELARQLAGRGIEQQMLRNAAEQIVALRAEIEDLKAQIKALADGRDANWELQ